MANIFTPGLPVSVGPYYIDRDDCIGDSLAWINANTNYLGYNISLNTANIASLQTQINNATLPGTVIQTSYSQISAGDITRNSTTPTEVTQVGTVTILSRQQTTSNIKIELQGGSAFCGTAGKGFRTWFYVNEGAGWQIPRTGGNGTIWNAVQLKTFPSTSTTDPHQAVFIYKPGPGVTSISAKVYAASLDTTSVNWNRGNNTNGVVPILFSISEIKAGNSKIFGADA